MELYEKYFLNFHINCVQSAHARYGLLLSHFRIDEEKYEIEDEKYQAIICLAYFSQLK